MYVCITDLKDAKGYSNASSSNGQSCHSSTGSIETWLLWDKTNNNKHTYINITNELAHTISYAVWLIVIGIVVPFTM